MRGIDRMRETVHGHSNSGSAPIRRLRFGIALALTVIAIAALAAMATAQNTGAGKAYVLTVDDAIGPATRDYIVRGIEQAEAEGAELVVLRMNTPGGLDASMRDIIRKILGSTVPVATWVAPPGSRAASAGTYILYASHVAAMAPSTNLGAATPVQIGGGGGGQEPERPRTPLERARDALTDSTEETDQPQAEAGGEVNPDDTQTEEAAEPADDADSETPSVPAS